MISFSYLDLANSSVSNFVVCVLGCFFGLGFVLFAG